ncbi:MAG TPA: serine/threonine-protein kinase [Actinocrinis sp.]|nr:serine/threonine-protein kinase [Actinocrinis sp.]
MHAPPNVFEPLRSGDPGRAGGYRLRARLGSGGMGEVFLAFTGDGRPLAVKVVRREFADDAVFRARFAHEVRAARRVGGPCIAPLVDADPDAEQPWLATAYVPGPTLADAVQLYGPLPVSTVIVLMSAIAEALGTIHAAGIVHRDLKPANVVLGGDGVRVIDFGIARATDATTLTLSGMLVGSPQYVAPEQVLGESPAPPGDVFALGALAHYAATGRAAFGEGPEVGVVYRVVHARPDLVGCPPQLRGLITSCLAKNPDDRPTTSEIAEMCRPDERPGEAEDWLPEPVVFAIGAYREALAEIAARPEDEPEPEPPPADDGAAAASQQPATDASVRVRPRTKRLALGIAAALAVAGAGAGVAIGISSANAPDGGSGLQNAAGATTAPSGDRGQGHQGQGQPPPPDGGGAGPDGQPPPPVPDPTTLLWTGTFRITGAGVWLDDEPPDLPTDGGHGDISEASPAPADEIASASGQVTNIALWTGSGTPTGPECRDLAMHHGVAEVHAGAGSTVCALTRHRHVAVLKIAAFPADFSGVTVTGTLWGGGDSN